MSSAQMLPVPMTLANSAPDENHDGKSVNSPSSCLSRDQAEHLLIQHLDLLDRLTAFAAKRNGIQESDREDLGSWIKLRLIENDYSILCKFRGISRFSTYLTTVVMGLARDYRIQRWGRWRPSIKAQRLGETAVLLERLLERDRYSLEEAIEILKTNHGITASRTHLRELAIELPQRQLRPRLEAITTHLLCAEEVVSKPQRGRRRLARLRVQLETALQNLPDQDRLLLKLHYGHGLAIAALAPILRLPQRSLYSRRNRVLRQLRRQLEAKGLRWPDIAELLAWNGIDLDGLAGRDELAREKEHLG